ncbi:MAG: hypothetical protein ABI867_20485 [Kofleriaceae bacterium]
MRLAVSIISPPVATALFWLAFVACIDQPIPSRSPPIARIVTTWDPLVCGDPHRVVMELADDEGARVSVSTPCSHATLSVDVPHFGTWSGRIYAWVLADVPIIRSELPVDLIVDEAVVRWIVQTPK